MEMCRKYKLLEMTVYDESGAPLKSYGIGFGSHRIHDICLDRERMVNQIRKCNRYKLDPSHLPDVVYDFLAML